MLHRYLVLAVVALSMSARSGRADDPVQRLPEEYDFQKNWNLEMLGARYVWALGQSPEVVVAVVDTGIDLAHEDLSTNLWEDKALGEKQKNGPNLVNPEEPPM